jgi:hypothetical protein
MDILDISVIFWEAYDDEALLEIECHDGAVFSGAPQQLYFDFLIMSGLGYPLRMIKDARIK